MCLPNRRSLTCAQVSSPRANVVATGDTRPEDSLEWFARFRVVRPRVERVCSCEASPFLGPVCVSHDPNSRRLLRDDAIIQTVETLARRIGERFPSAGLGDVCDELIQVARQASVRAEAIRRPNWWLRAAIGLILVGMLVSTTYVISRFRFPQQPIKLVDGAFLFEAAINDVVLIGAAVFFLITLETRLKRRRALTALHELRSLAHIIDMHQLTKDPVVLVDGSKRTASSPERSMTMFELSRYLDYCNEMLSLCGKIASLYVQQFPDPVAIQAVNEIESLTTGLSRKIWQKIVLAREQA